MLVTLEPNGLKVFGDAFSNSSEEEKRRLCLNYIKSLKF